MKCQVYSKEGGFEERAASLTSDMLCCGGKTFPGMSIDGPYAHTFDTAEYAVNEGGMLRDIWNYDEPDDSITMAFCISEASANELYALRLVDAALAPFTEITLPSGEQIIANADGVLMQRGNAVGLCELGPDFVLRADVRELITATSAFASIKP